MLADVATDHFAVLCVGVGQYVLDEVISKLIASNCKTISNITTTGRSVFTYCQSRAYEDDLGDLRIHAPGIGPRTRCYQS